ncbi:MULTISPECIES: GNAT family N-acetyltransferase [unclassified Streptomyces]|uniref:GNAT family N-acetyltransferase n=1 Tax=unclassified Streptomyces TaxID=2593676 RepID=UPI001EF85130|nr:MULTISPECIES: GNAT family N-acetyltransferase [unclassified Streptomyces]
MRRCPTNETVGEPLTPDEAREKIRAALARAAQNPRAQWSWAILAGDDVVGLISVRRRSPTMEAMHHPDNPASGRVLAKTGFAPSAPEISGTTTDRSCHIRHTHSGRTDHQVYALLVNGGCPGTEGDRAIAGHTSTKP